MSLRLFLLCVCMLSCAWYVRSQPQNIRFEHISTSQGLSHSTVLSLLQDSRKFIWVGTKDGLNRYDGYKFIVYKNDPQQVTSISNNIITDIAEDTLGNIWVATWGGGLNKFDRDKERFVRFLHDPANGQSISSDFVSSLLIDHEGKLWIGTGDAGLNQMVGENFFKHYSSGPTNSDVPDTKITSLFEDSENKIWIGTESGGLCVYHPENRTFKTIQHDASNPASLSANNVHFVFEDSRKRLWVGMYGGGLNLYNRSTGEFRHFAKELSNGTLSHNFLLSMGEDAAGTLWIGTENDGLNIFDPQTGNVSHFKNLDTDVTSLSSNTVNTILRDEKGNLWIGTLNGGLNLLNRDANKFTHYRKNQSSESLSNNYVTCFYEDVEGHLWIGTDGGGLNQFDRNTKKFRHLKHNGSPSISGNYVLSVVEDNERNLWLGTWGNGITVYNPQRNTYQFYNSQNQLPSNNIWTLYKTRNGDIWIGTFDSGLTYFNSITRKFKHFWHKESERNSLSSNTVLSIYEDRDGELWVGTDGGGLNRLNTVDSSYMHYKHSVQQNSISNNSVGCIYEDSKGNLWLGTNLGLNAFNKHNNTFTVYQVKDGLPNDVILGIVEDDDGYLWISSNKGLTRFNPAKKEFRNFTVADGLQGNEFKERAFYKSRTGQLYFGGRNGFNEFFPTQVQDVPYDPPVVITELLLFNKRVPVTDKFSYATPLTKSITETRTIVLSHKQTVISFEFAALNYTAPERKQYAYKLEGFDESWTNAGMRNNVTYTNLDPGEYKFLVRAQNNAGEWSTNITQLKVVIVPPFWKTWWFNTLSVLCILGAFAAFHRYRLRAIHKRKVVLEKMVNERTEEIEEQARKIEKMNALLRAHNEKLEHDVEDITKARVMEKQLTFDEFRQIFPDDEACYNYLVQLKWKTEYVCKKCRNKTYSLWKNSHTRRCTRCNYIESATAFTIFHSLKFSILKAFYMLFLIHSQKNITADELSAIVGISSKTCKTFRKKIEEVNRRKKSKKKPATWEDFILVDVDKKLSFFPSLLHHMKD